MQYDPWALPFWAVENEYEARRDRAIARFRRYQWDIEHPDYTAFDIQVELFHLQYGEERQFTSQYSIECMTRQLCELGLKPWPKPQRHTGSLQFAPDYSQVNVRSGGSQGDGNRWRGHGNCKGHWK
jgi:hypothetical protein